MIPNIRKPLRRFLPHLLQAREIGANEADTVARLRRFFEQVLGYDALIDITGETQLKNKYVDLCLKIEGNIRLLVEAKAAGIKLRERHIEQAQAYASHNNYRWVVLTNGVEWHLYHLTFDEGIEYERAFAVSLATDEGFDEAARKLALLDKQAIRKGELEAFWEKATAMCASSIGKALFSENVLKHLRREIRRDAGVLIDPEDLAKAVHDMLCQEAREQIGPVRIRKKKRTIKKKPAAKSSQRESTVNASSAIKNSGDVDEGVASGTGAVTADNASD